MPGGFGDRGVEGKIAAIRHAREAKVPFLGICLGMQVRGIMKHCLMATTCCTLHTHARTHTHTPPQCAVIEYARTVLGWSNANSAEFVPSLSGPSAVVIFMPEINPSQMGGTMRLGARATVLRPRADGKRTLAAGASQLQLVSQLQPASGLVQRPPTNAHPRPALAPADVYADARSVWERHRHRYEVNPEAVAPLTAAGLHFVGTDDRSQRMEIVELDRE